MYQKRVLCLLLALNVVKLVFTQDSGGNTEISDTKCSTPNEEPGLCIELKHCPKLRDKLNNANTLEYIKASRCGFAQGDITRPKVCCQINGDPFEDIDIAEELMPESNSVTSTSPFPTVSDNLLPHEDCGKQPMYTEDKILGGAEANIGEFPWLAILIHRNKYNVSKPGCSGFLIHAKFVLTAAHCFQDDRLGQLEHIILGVHNDTKNGVCIDRECKVKSMPKVVSTCSPIIHENYDKDLIRNDIALIPLRDEITFTGFVSPICLAKTAGSSKSLTVSGWGRTEHDTRSQTKLKVDLPRVNLKDCIQKFKTAKVSLIDTHLCAGGVTGKDSCSGDSGGPLMHFSEDQRWYAEGIASFGNECGLAGWPGVYTNVPSFYNWIVYNMMQQLQCSAI